MLIINIIKLSFRSIIRDRRRSIITFIIAFLSFIALGLYSGYSKTIRDIITSGSIHGDYGHIQIFRENTPKEIIESGLGTYEYMITKEEFEKVKKICQNIREVMYVTPRDNITGMVGNEKNSRVFQAEAISPSDAMNLYSYLPVTGDFINENNKDGIVLGKTLADEIGAKIGDTVLVVASSKRGSLEALNCKVAGFYSLGSSYVDRYRLYLNINTAKDLTLTESCNKIIVLLDENENMLKVQDMLNAEFKKQGLGLKAYNFYQVAVLYKQIFDSYESQANVSLLVLGIVIFFSMLNGLYMSITDKAREFTTMRTLGISRTVMFFVIICESLMLILIALAVGNILLSPIAGLINKIKIMLPPYIGGNKSYPLFIITDGWQALKISLILVGVGFLGGVLPAMNVVRLKIIKGLSAE